MFQRPKTLVQLCFTEEMSVILENEEMGVVLQMNLVMQSRTRLSIFTQLTALSS